MRKKLSSGRVKKSTKKGGFFENDGKGGETRFARMDIGKWIMSGFGDCASNAHNYPYVHFPFPERAGLGALRGTPRRGGSGWSYGGRCGRAFRRGPIDRRADRRQGETGPVASICSGAFFGPHTVSHLPINALDVSGAALGVPHLFDIFLIEVLQMAHSRLNKSVFP
jgi:hypothetical protein